MDVYGKTHIGKVRQLNEDSIFISSETIGDYDNLFAIADGMGGHNAGEIASSLAVESFAAYLKEKLSVNKEQGLIDGVSYANKVIYEKSILNTAFKGMGTTLVACSIEVDDDGMIYIANVGDSRLYILGETLDQITVDHSYVEDLVRAGEITREESLTHPERNIITRALGTSELVKIDMFILKKTGVKKIFFCSDGLTNMVPDIEIETILKMSISSEEAIEKLVSYALEAGGIDNITGTLINIEKANEEVVPTC
ncbi:MAG: Stp1/IreP family PP2C-type Ser/Thr phosphatase [Vallitaleaceae bacterium]|jgi:serine/threonine protein phosphatase PrpC|nr:Stp1/IreP family PP2C-type Ser/Thr phosphatase [Vallitaleaceae bacterium]